MLDPYGPRYQPYAVAQPEVRPWCAVCKVRVNGIPATAWAFAPRVLVTAAHALPNTGNANVVVNYFPQSQAGKLWEYRDQMTTVVSGEIGMIRLPQSLLVGTLEPAPDADVELRQVWIPGFPGQEQTLFVGCAERAFAADLNKTVRYWLGTVPGFSGAPVWSLVGIGVADVPRVVGVHQGLEEATYLDQTVLNTLQGQTRRWKDGPT